MGTKTIAVLVTIAFSVIGVVVFRESLNHFEVVGIVLAVISLVLLMRFA